MDEAGKAPEAEATEEQSNIVAFDEAKKKHKKKHTTYFDYGLLAMVLLILAIGLVMLYSTTAYTAQAKFGDPAHFLKRQAIFAGLGFVAMYIASRIPHKLYGAFSGWIYLLSLGLCIAVNFVGDRRGGSSRWFQVGSITFQPSEFAKVGIILFTAYLISKMSTKFNSYKAKLVALVPTVIMAGAIVTNNLSTAIIVSAVGWTMLFIANKKKGFWWIVLILGGIAGAAATFLVGYRKNRIGIFLHPEDYEEGFQTLQGLYAIGSGGLFGKGLGASVQKLGNVPVAQNDMIFSIICEELGLFGAVCIIILYILLIWRLLFIARHARDLLGSFIAIGIMVHVAMQVCLNIAVVTNSIPNTGVTLPLISYGGTSVFILLTEFGIALSVARSVPLDVYNLTGLDD